MDRTTDTHSVGIFTILSNKETWKVSRCVRLVRAGTWENVGEVDLVGLDPDAAVEGILTGRAAYFQVKEHRVKGGAVEAVPKAKRDADN